MNSHTLEQSKKQPAPIAPAVAITPEFFPVPKRGVDPHFGIGRGSYYDLEKRGLLRLVRIRKPGNILGKVLVPYAETAALIRSFASKSAKNEPV